jgi:hypothetical protein
MMMMMMMTTTMIAAAVMMTVVVYLVYNCFRVFEVCLAFCWHVESSCCDILEFCSIMSSIFNSFDIYSFLLWYVILFFFLFLSLPSIHSDIKGLLFWEAKQNN